MFLKEGIIDMKNKNSVEQYFHQKNFSVLEIILLIIAIASLIAATFIQGGGPIGLPILLVCIVGFFACHSSKVKDNEIEQALKKIMQDHKVECSENAIQCYELKNTVIKKRKDGKFISPNYYITDITFAPEYTLFNTCIINLVEQSVETISQRVNCNEKITLTEETIKTDTGFVKTSHLEFENGRVIPVTLNDYRSSKLLQKICDRHK